MQYRGVQGLTAKALKVWAQNVTRLLKAVNNLPVLKYLLLNKCIFGNWAKLFTELQQIGSYCMQNVIYTKSGFGS